VTRSLSRRTSARPGTTEDGAGALTEPALACPVGGERRLTPGEIALARGVFGNAVD
jgi:hypothetical protein